MLFRSRPMRWLIENKRLSEYKIYAPKTQPSFESIKIRHGDYAVDEIEKVMDKPSLTGDAVTHYKKFANGLRAICYCVSIKHSKHVAESFNANGVPAVHIDGTSSEEEIKNAVSGFADGRYQILCNVELMTTGFDLSAQVNRDVPIEACILLRPTASVSLYLQMVGRALRMKDDPAVILDHAGCCHRHGLPDDEHEWCLEGETSKKRKKQKNETPIKQCEKCYAIYRPTEPVCPSCGATNETRQRRIEVVEGVLEQLDIGAIRQQQKREQGGARTLKDLVEDRKSTRLNSSHIPLSRMPSSA